MLLYLFPTTCICMDELNLILVLFTFGLYESFAYKYVVQMWGFNNVMTGYKLISKTGKKWK